MLGNALNIENNRVEETNHDDTSIIFSSMESHSPLTVQGHSLAPDTQLSQGSSPPVNENSPHPRGKIGDSAESQVKLRQPSVFAHVT